MYIRLQGRVHNVLHTQIIDLEQTLFLEKKTCHLHEMLKAQFGVLMDESIIIVEFPRNNVCQILKIKSSTYTHADAKNRPNFVHRITV